jgi:hypothetical protein
MPIGEATREAAHEVGIPHPDGVVNADLTHEQAVHPSEGELHELDVLRSQMGGEGCY